ncbi:hypothetical protein EXIGLDRAFT_681540, partial [Exidia glandulosa HHB12029]
MIQELGQVRAKADALKTVGRARKFLKASPNLDLLKEMTDRVKTARDIFAFRGQVSIEMLIRELVAKSRHEALQREQDQESAKWSKVLKRLPRADAGYSASVHARHGRLLAGTRTDLLRELDDWATSAPTAQDQSPFFVLTGGAGTGKSTIAFDVARRAEARGHLGASFFFMRGAASLDSTELIFPTLAWQMLSNVPGLRSPASYSVIETHLQRGGPQNLDQQADDLFVKLLSTLPATQAPITIVIDAVDECSASTQDFVQRMLFLIMQSLSSIACTVRVFITSRPEVHVEDALRSLTFQSKTQRFRLQDIPQPTVDHDISLFFTNALSQLPEASRLALSSVYGDAAGELTERAAGLFIYAATAVEYLRWFRGDDILVAIAQILATDVDATKPGLDRLDELYTIVLNTAFPPQFLALPGKAALVAVALSSIAVLQDHVSPRVIAVLAGLDLTSGLVPVLERLAPVLSFDPSDADVAMRPLHASFAEFLGDSARSTSTFWVDSSEQHSVFAGYALNLLMKRGTLVSNVCRLEHPNDTPIAVPDIRERITLHLPPAVQYACLYWASH